MARGQPTFAVDANFWVQAGEAQTMDEAGQCWAHEGWLGATEITASFCNVLACLPQKGPGNLQGDHLKRVTKRWNPK